LTLWQKVKWLIIYLLCFVIIYMQGVKLSPNAKSFVPEFFTGSVQKSLATQQMQHCGLLDMSCMPGYMTASYPLTNYDYAHNLQWVKKCTVFVLFLWYCTILTIIYILCLFTNLTECHQSCIILTALTAMFMVYWKVNFTVFFVLNYCWLIFASVCKCSIHFCNLYLTEINISMDDQITMYFW